MTLSTTDRTKLNNLSPNLAPNQVAASALRLAVFQEIYTYMDNIIADLNAYQGAGAVKSVNLADGSILSVKLADNAITGAKLLDGAVATLKLADGSVTRLKLADKAVGAGQLDDAAVTLLKMAAEAKDSSNHTYGGSVPDVTTTKTAIDATYDRLISAIGTSSVSEVVEARKDNVYGVTALTLKDRLEKNAKTLALKADKAYVDTQISSVASGSPKGVYATLTDLQTAFPTGNTNIYLISADGKWYYWNASAWTAGGTYQSTGLAAASVDIDKVDQYMNDIIIKGKANEGQTFLMPSTGTSVTGDTNTFVIDKPLPVRTTIQRIKINASFVGTIRVCIMQKLSETSFKCISLVSFQSVVGEKVYEINLPVPQSGLYLAISGGKVRYLLSDVSNPDAYGLYDIINTTFTTGATVSASKSVATIQFQMQVYLDYETELRANRLFNPLKGKTLLVIGDSISDKNNTTYCSTYYYDHLNTVDGLKYIMDGRSGTGYLRPFGADLPIPDRIDAYPVEYNPDYISIFSGTNDWFQGGKPLGVKGDTAVNTFYGALKVTFDKLINKYPLAKVLIATPIRRTVESSPNPQGNTLKEFRDAIIEMAHDYCFTVIDLYLEGGVNPLISISRSTYFTTPTGSLDGTHPNDAGQLRLYPKFRMGLLQS